MRKQTKQTKKIVYNAKVFNGETLAKIRQLAKEMNTNYDKLLHICELMFTKGLEYGVNNNIEEDKNG